MSFRYVLKDDHTEQPTLYKLHFGNRYLVWKGKNLKHSVETICKDVSRFHANGCPPEHMLTKVIDQVTRYRCLFCRVEILLQTDNVTQLIEAENLTLEKSKEDPNCLNIKFEAHIPKWMLDHGQVALIAPAQNKALQDTFSPRKVSIPQSEPKVKPGNKIPASTGKISLMDALKNLKATK